MRKAVIIGLVLAAILLLFRPDESDENYKTPGWEGYDYTSAPTTIIKTPIRESFKTYHYRKVTHYHYLEDSQEEIPDDIEPEK